MTEKQKRSLAENARIYHAEGDVPPRSEPVGRRSAGAWIFCGVGIVLLAVWTGSPISADKAASAAGYALSRICRASARAELVSLTDILSAAFSSSGTDIHMNEPPSEGNNINSGGTLVLSGDDAHMLSYGSRRMPSSANEEIIVDDLLPEPSETDDTPLPYPSDLSGHDGIISSLTYEKGTGENYIDLPMGGQIRNVTSLSSEEIYENAVLAPDFKIKLNAPEDEPQVLIMHTHTTESYEPYTRDFYDGDFLCRTTDSSKNMTAVGSAMTDVLESRGIRTLHDVTIHDYPSYNGSYDRSRVTVSEILEKYPSIKVVLDVHRDAIERESGERIAPCADIGGRSAAQVMIICGCDDGTMGMPECMKNLRTASLFQQHMESKYSGLTRPVLFDYRQYNQDLTTGSLLIEVGGHANSLEQAIYAGELTADAIADALIGIAEE